MNIEKRRRLYDTLSYTFILLSAVFWYVFSGRMQEARADAESNIPIGYLVTASIFTIIAIVCYRRRRRL